MLLKFKASFFQNKAFVSQKRQTIFSDSTVSVGTNPGEKLTVSAKMLTNICFRLVIRDKCHNGLSTLMGQIRNFWFLCKDFGITRDTYQSTKFSP